MRKLIQNKKGVSEIVGTVLLLGMAIALFAIVHIVALNVIPFASDAPSVRINVEITNKTIFFQHDGGDPLALDTTKVIFSDVSGTPIEPSHQLKNFTFLPKDTDPKDLWNIGEILAYTPTPENFALNFENKRIQIMIIDINSNSIIMNGEIKIQNRPPIISSPKPSNGAYVSSDIDQLEITIIDPDNDAFSWTIETQPDKGSNSGIMQVYTENNFYCTVSGLEEDTPYTWYVNASDEYGETERIFTFNTGAPEHKYVFNSYNINSGTVSNIDGVRNDISPDDNEMELQEEHIISSAVDEYLYVNARDTTHINWRDRGISPQLDTIDGEIIEHGGSKNQLEGYFQFEDTLNTGIGFTVDFQLYCYGVDSDEKVLIFYSDSNFVEVTVPQAESWVSASSPVTMSADEINALSVYLQYFGTPAAKDVFVDAMRIHITRTAFDEYELDVNYNWEGLYYDSDVEEVCFYLTGSISENLLVHYWDGNSWELLGIPISNTYQWYNFTAIGLDSSTYSIKVTDADRTGDTIQDSWAIDCMFIHTKND